MMRDLPQNKQLISRLSGGSTSILDLPKGYSELAGQIAFTNGQNPLGAPELEMTCRNRAADSVERTTKLNSDGSFYTIVKQGQTYDLAWVLPSGVHQRFHAVRIPATAPRQLRWVLKYNPNGSPGSS